LFWTHDYSKKLDLPVHMAASEDSWKNWSEPFETNITGQISCPVPVCGDTVLAIYNCRTNSLGQGVKAIISYDGGKTWDLQNEETLWAAAPAGTGKADETILFSDMQLWTFGHPDVIKTGDNRFLAAHYCSNGKTTMIQAVTLTLE
jgi:hypothetical protein